MLFVIKRCTLFIAEPWPVLFNFADSTSCLSETETLVVWVLKKKSAFYVSFSKALCMIFAYYVFVLLLCVGDFVTVQLLSG